MTPCPLFETDTQIAARMVATLVLLFNGGKTQKRENGLFKTVHYPKNVTTSDQTSLFRSNCVFSKEQEIWIISRAKCLLIF